VRGTQTYLPRDFPKRGILGVMTTTQSEGIVLNSTPYQESNHITTLFTYELGLIRLFVRGTLRMRHHSHLIVTPLTRGDFLLVQGRGSLFKLRDGVITEPYLAFRESSSKLQTACEMARALLKTQYPHKASPVLYNLMVAYLDRLAHSSDPLLTTFYLKLIKHEGLLATDGRCLECGRLEDQIHWSSRGAYCADHAPYDAISLTREEWDLIQNLATARKFEEMNSIPPALQRKVALFFQNL